MSSLLTFTIRWGNIVNMSGLSDILGRRIKTPEQRFAKTVSRWHGWRIEKYIPKWAYVIFEDVNKRKLRAFISIDGELRLVNAYEGYKEPVSIQCGDPESAYGVFNALHKTLHKETI